MDAVRSIAQAVLYEGYLLWPYRRSALKNQHRFTIGGLYPREYADRYADRSEAAFECLVEGKNPQLELEVRFLQVVRRQVCVNGRAVDAVTVGETRWLSWDETVERSVTAGPFACEAGEHAERLSAENSLVRSWERIEGRAELAAQCSSDGLHRVSVRIVNETAASSLARDAVLRRTLVACHAVVRVRDGAFLSTVDPPAAFAQAARECTSDGLWPVLVGAAPARDTLLAAPIILEEYPQIAPETPCDFFDGAEIGELLARSILSLADSEKDEIRATDPRGRALLQRVESLTPAELARMHGGLRSEKSVG